MGIQSWSEDVILVNLPRELEEHNELQTVVAMVREKEDCNVVIDFSNVDIVGSTTFARLLELRQVVHDRGHKLVLCGVAPATKGVFTVARLDGLFDFVADRFAALATLQMIG
jgi:anti-anti-sigma factor